MRRGTSGRVVTLATASPSQCRNNNTAAAAASESTSITAYTCGVTGKSVRASDLSAHCNSDTFLRNKLIFDRLQGGEYIEGGYDNPRNPLFLGGGGGSPARSSSSTQPLLLSAATREPLRNHTVDLSSSAAKSLNMAFTEDSEPSSSSSVEKNGNNEEENVSTTTATSSPSTSADPAITTKSANNKATPSLASFWKNTGKSAVASSASISLEDQGESPADVIAAHRVPPPPLAPNRIWEALSKNVLLMKEFNLPRHSQRLGRANVALKFLRDHHVILHSALRWNSNNGNGNSKDGGSSAAVTSNSGNTNQSSVSESSGTTPAPSSSSSRTGSGGTWNVSTPFYRVAMVGEVQLRTEITTRMNKLFPLEAISGATFAAAEDNGNPEGNKMKRTATMGRLIAECYSVENLAKLYDNLELNRILETEGRRQSPLDSKQKASMICAIAGELHWFVARTKATDRTKVTALFPPSDVLILHVLSVHVLEIFTASLAYQVVRPGADRILKHSWPFSTSSFVEQVADRTPALSKVLRLQSEPRPFDANRDALSNLLHVDPYKMGTATTTTTSGSTSSGGEVELARRVHVIVEAEKAAIQRLAQHTIDALNKGLQKLEAKMKNLELAASEGGSVVESGSGGGSLAIDAETLKKRRIQAVSDMKVLTESREKKVKAIKEHLTSFQAGVDKRKGAVELKYKGLMDAINVANTNSSNKIGGVSGSSSSKGGSVDLLDVVVKPLLHTDRFIPHTSVRREVSHSEVVLNFKALNSTRQGSSLLTMPAEVDGGYLDVSKRVLGASMGERLGNALQLSPRPHASKKSPPSTTPSPSQQFMGLKAFVAQQQHQQ